VATKKKAGAKKQPAKKKKKAGSSSSSVARPVRSRAASKKPAIAPTIDPSTPNVQPIAAEPALPECNEKELAFVIELLKKPGNGSAAMIAAGITDKPDVAKVYASQYLDRPHVLAELERRRARLMDKLDLSLDRVLEEIRRIALANLVDVVHVHGAGVAEDGDGKKYHYHGELEFRDLDKLPVEVTAAIAGVTITPGEFGTKREIRMHPKLDALKALLEHLSPSDAEKRGGIGGIGAGSTIVIEGGPTGLEVTVTQRKK
jgi:hypothetical protein